MWLQVKTFADSTFRAALPFLVATTAFFLIFFFVIRFCMVQSDLRGHGIIGLEGYQHAVVICGEEFTVNEGHMKDPQVKEIRELAIKHCPNGEKDIPTPTER